MSIPRWRHSSCRSRRAPVRSPTSGTPLLATPDAMEKDAEAPLLQRVAEEEEMASGGAELRE